MANTYNRETPETNIRNMKFWVDGCLHTPGYLTLVVYSNHFCVSLIGLI